VSEGRQYWTPKQWRDQFEKQGCACAYCPETAGPFIAEHEIPNFFQPGKPSCILCKACAVAKTKLDMADIAKAKRRAGLTGQQARLAKRKAEGKGGSIPSRPFQQGHRPLQSRSSFAPGRKLQSRSSFERRDEPAALPEGRSAEDILKAA